MFKLLRVLTWPLRALARRAGPARPDEPVSVEQVVNALLLTDFEEIDPWQEAVIANWTDRQREEAFEWACREHLSASDNDDVERLPCPADVRALRGARQ